ncbi:hypothetical protein [Sedimenticola sp.]|uniref:hypothetical protein n=1 Tax=Sedimenticola sp. TaxID=1940285 RepID=UPI003D0D099C
MGLTDSASSLASDSFEYRPNDNPRARTLDTDHVRDDFLNDTGNFHIGEVAPKNTENLSVKILPFTLKDEVHAPDHPPPVQEELYTSVEGSVLEVEESYALCELSIANGLQRLNIPTLTFVEPPVVGAPFTMMVEIDDDGFRRIKVKPRPLNMEAVSSAKAEAQKMLDAF